MRHSVQFLEFETKRQFELVNITEQVQKTINDQKVQSGIVVVFCPHTTASIRITQHEPLLMQDIMKTLYRVVPFEENYSHDLFEIRQNLAVNERSNGHAHVKSFLLGSSEAFVIDEGNIMLGEHQNIFLVEFDGGRKRKVMIKILED